MLKGSQVGKERSDERKKNRGEEGAPEVVELKALFYSQRCSTLLLG